MPVTSEKVYDPKSADVKDDSALAKLLLPLAAEDELSKWKISTFESTPPVRPSVFGSSPNIYYFFVDVHLYCGVG